MMNILALCLVATSLATAGVWSPSPDHPPNPVVEKEVIADVIVAKEGLKVIVVEYEKEGTGKTKVSISPHDQSDHKPSTTTTTTTTTTKTVEIEDKNSILETAGEVAKEKLSTAKDKIQEATSAVGESLSGSKPPEKGHSGSPKEVISDAFGKGKDKIVGALSKAKEKVEEKAHQVGDEAKEAVEAIGDAIGKGKEAVSEKVHEIEEGAKDAYVKTKDKVKDAVDVAKTLKGDAKRNVTEEVSTMHQQVVKKAKEWETVAEKVKKDSAKFLKEDSKKDIKEVLRRGKEVLRDGFDFVGSSKIMGEFLEVVHLMGFSMAYGMAVWITFISTYVLAEALPRQQFGLVQSKLYPVYFRVMACCIGVALLGHLLSQRKSLYENKADMFQGYILITSLLLVSANLFYFEPQATKVMFETMKMEKEEGRGIDGFVEPLSVTNPPAAAGATSGSEATTHAERVKVAKDKIGSLIRRLKRLNSNSSFLNILTLMALSWHLVYIGQRLHMSKTS